MWNLIKSHLGLYPIYKGLNYTTALGYILFLTIAGQFLSGVILSCFYTPTANEAYNSIQYIINEVIFGYYIQRFHAINANIIFILIVIHVLRSIFYQITHCTLVWLTGILIYICLILIAFTGYVLPWGQMSYWGVIVITNLISVIPFIGYWLLHVIWGGSVLGDLIIKRCFTLHYLLGTFIFVLILLHIYTLHINKTSLIKKLKFGVLPTGYRNLYPLFILKDFFSFLFSIFIIFLLVYYWPYTLDNPTNIIPAAYVVTPKHIIPEIYFLIFYSALKLVSSKIIGIGIMGCMVLSFLFYLYQKNKII